MKCPKCNGRKKILEPCDGALLGTVLVTCDVCDGTGEVTMTNEEWFCSLSTEEKAKWLEDKMMWAAQEQGTFTSKGWIRWLKEIHKE